MGHLKKIRKCPRCKSKNITLQESYGGGIDVYVCDDCEHEFEIGWSKTKHRNDDKEFDEKQMN